MNFMKLTDLVPYSKNHRVHKSNAKRLANVIKTIGWGAPILVQSKTNRIIGGHGRYAAAKLIMKEDPSYKFDTNAPDAGYVPVRILDVSDAIADAMSIADNSSSLQGEDDTDALLSLATSEYMMSLGLNEDLGFDKEIKQATKDNSNIEKKTRKKKELTASYTIEDVVDRWKLRDEQEWEIPVSETFSLNIMIGNAGDYNNFSRVESGRIQGVIPLRIAALALEQCEKMGFTPKRKNNG